MSYRVLARKYRPQTFEDMIGQSHVATTLGNALRNHKVAHAYLFSGPRGVGKTTSARILAKALNCAKGPTPTPCNACDSCQRIALGQEMVDIIEIDAASNRGIEEIRELRENVVYAPAHSRYKVYIIDEAHQITHDAFNAFLKTLEEPPAHAVFIMATTEHQKIPATILSRCQLFRFKRVSADDITAQLGRILTQEKVDVEPAALARLSRAAGGSVRDALSLLDQALAYTSEKLTVQHIETLLGFLPEEFIQGYLGALLAKDPAQVMQWVKRLSDEGWDLPQFVRDFREFLREAFVEQLAAGSKPESLTLAQKTVTLAEVLQIVKVLGQAQDDMRWNDNPRLVLELYSLRLTQPFVDAGFLLRKIEALEKGLPAAGEPAARMDPVPPPSAARAPVFSAPTPVPPSPAAQRPAQIERPILADTPETAIPASPGSTDVTAQWKQVLAELWKRPSLGAQMERARLQSSSEKEWIIAFSDKYAVDVAQRSLALIQETVAKAVGHSLAVRFVQSTKAAVVEEQDNIVVTPSTQGRSSGGDERQSAAVKDAGVQKILQAFKGRIREEE